MGIEGIRMFEFDMCLWGFVFRGWMDIFFGFFMK